MEYDYESASCYCSTTSSPPCGYCEGMGDCDECGRHFRCEDMQEIADGRLVCADCYEKLREEADK